MFIFSFGPEGLEPARGREEDLARFAEYMIDQGYENRYNFFFVNIDTEI